MAGELTINAETRGLAAALERLGPAAERVVDRVAKETAERIQAAARARAQWGATGQTREAITVEKADTPLGGYRVFVGRTNDPEGFARSANLPLWIHFGTRKWAGHPDFLFGPARLEEGSHLRRLGEALQGAITAEGLGG